MLGTVTADRLPLSCRGPRAVSRQGPPWRPAARPQLCPCHGADPAHGAVFLTSRASALRSVGAVSLDVTRELRFWSLFWKGTVENAGTRGNLGDVPEMSGGLLRGGSSLPWRDHARSSGENGVCPCVFLRPGRLSQEVLPYGLLTRSQSQSQTLRLHHGTAA